ncbi:MAG: hypothetical protein EXR76_10530 [Myxococcales bacterium]|nr:hypothetical protein [Myxococcales bacterium]
MIAALCLVGLFAAPDLGVATGTTPPPAQAAAPAVGPPPEVTVTCAPEPVRVGEPLVCTLVAVHPDTMSVTVPLPSGATEVSAMDVSAAATTARTDGKLSTLRRFALVPKEPKATLKVPAVTVSWQESAGGVGALEIPARKVAIKRLLEGADSAEPRTFKAPGGEAEPFFEAHGPVVFIKTNWALLITCIVVLATAVGIGLGWLIKRFLDARRRAALPWVDSRPAHVIALEALEQLAAERLPDQGRVKEFYFRLSEIVRLYLERRFDFAAREMTSDEIRAHFSPREPTGPKLCSPQAHLAIEDFLSETDLVKFADFAPMDSAADTAMRASRGIIELTRPPETSDVPEPRKGDER